jgi:hypothetical protein
MKSAPLNRHSENVVVKAVVIAELKFSDIQRQVLADDLVERIAVTAHLTTAV